MIRRTKIIATLGPSTDDPQVLTRMLDSGISVVRINCSHSDWQQHQARIEQVRQLAHQRQQVVAILADLQGPKIRMGSFSQGTVSLQAGDAFELIHNQPIPGDAQRVFVDTPLLAQLLRKGDQLVFGDGAVTAQVRQITETSIITEITTAGSLKSRQGVNRFGGGLALPIPEKDRQDITEAIAAQVDYIAVSFVRGPDDIRRVRTQLGQHPIGVVAKFECREALDQVHDIMALADAMMVARGDLGIEIGLESVPAIQKDLIQQTRSLDKVAITATQMLDSMTEKTTPTRAEVSDVVNAILDGTDAIMLSQETAVGRHPDQVIATANKICLQAEQHPLAHTSQHRVECRFNRTDEAMAMAAMYIANHHPLRAIVSLTETGSTPLWMSRIRSHIPIYALTRHRSTLHHLALYRGVLPLLFDVTGIDREHLQAQILQFLKQQRLVASHDHIMLTHGQPLGQRGHTNTIGIIQVDEH